MAKVTAEAKQKQLTVYLPDTRGVTLSRFGIGNLKIGLGVHTYSRLPGLPENHALGSDGRDESAGGTCPGATVECQAICYAARPVTEGGPVFEMWRTNSLTEDVPDELPPDCTMLRLHISGDFTTQGYINGWFALLATRPDVVVWAYTRSWRVPSLLPALERLRALPNVQLFASIDKSTPDVEVAMISDLGWRRAWIDGDHRANQMAWDEQRTARKRSSDGLVHNRRTSNGTMSLVCPEETGRQPNCVTCGYCQHGRKNDVTFLKH